LFFLEELRRQSWKPGFSLGGQLAGLEHRPVFAILQGATRLLLQPDREFLGHPVRRVALPGQNHATVFEPHLSTAERWMADGVNFNDRESAALCGMSVVT
jgi:hypothetical protein